MRSVVILGASQPLGRAVLEVIGRNRGEFMVDGLLDDGLDARWLAEQVLEFTPLRLGITDEYEVGRFHGERDDLRLDAGLVDWELADLEVVAGPDALTQLAAMPADVVVVALADEQGRQAADLARDAGAPLLLDAAELPDSSTERVAQLLGVVLSD